LRFELRGRKRGNPEYFKILLDLASEQNQPNALPAFLDSSNCFIHLNSNLNYLWGYPKVFSPFWASANKPCLLPWGGSSLWGIQANDQEIITSIRLAGIWSLARILNGQRNILPSDTIAETMYAYRPDHLGLYL
jgi:hypothetical protein